MWVVRGLGVGYHQSGVHAVSNVYNVSMLPDFDQLIVTLYETSSGREVMISSKDKDSFVRTLLSYNPYGFVLNVFDGPITNGAIFSTSLFVVIDNLVLKFLEYVDRVETVQFKASHPIVMGYFDWSKLEHKLSRFKSVDKLSTILAVSPPSRISWCGCTLFHAVAYTNKAWDGHDFYLFDSRFEMCGDKFTKLHRVVFSDVDQARRLITKASVLNYHNPIVDFELK